MAKSILGIVAGFAAWSVLWLAGGQAVTAVVPNAIQDDVVSSTGVLLVFLVLSVICSLVAGFIAGAIARTNAIGTSLVLGIVLLGVGIGVQSGVWDKMPLWYHLSFLALLIPMAMAGARIRGGGRSPVVTG